MRLIDKLTTLLRLKGGVEFFQLEKGEQYITAKQQQKQKQSFIAVNVGID